MTKFNPTKSLDQILFINMLGMWNIRYYKKMTNVFIIDSLTLLYRGRHGSVTMVQNKTERRFLVCYLYNPKT